MSQVNIRLSQPSLRPQIELEQKLLISQPIDWMTATATFSSKSGVAVLTSVRGATNGTSSFISYDIKAGRKIAKLESIYGADISNISLSPNGRVAAVPAHKGIAGNEVVFLDTETGNILSRLDETIGVQAWLPIMSAALLKHNANSTISLADFATGKVSPYEIDSKVQRWGVIVNSSPARLLVGADNAFYLVENERTAYGVKSTIVKDFYPKQNQYSAYNSPIIMLDGKVAVFTLGNFLVKYDLATGKAIRIEIYPFLDKKFEKLDEETMLTKVSNSSELKVFNIKDVSISSIKDEISKYGSLSALNGRNGCVRRERNQFWLGEKLEIGQAKSLAVLLAERNAEEQLRLAEEKTRHEKEIEIFGTPLYGDAPPPERPPQAVVLDQSLQKDKPVNQQLTKSNFPGAPSLISANTKIEFIGVKESANAVSNEISVMIQKTNMPIILILSSCKPVKWKLMKQPDSRLLAVLQEVPYVANAVDINSSDYSTSIMSRRGDCIHKKDSPEYKTLDNQVLQWTGKQISKFQSAESGIAFSVGN
jgi:hypothetical protein